MTKEKDDVLEFLRSFIAGGVNQDFKPWASELYQKLYHAAEPAASPQAPIAKITVRESGAGHYAPDDVHVSLYAPGLPPGTHDVYCEPEAVAPYMCAEPSERLADCEASLRIYDPGHTSEYWLRHTQESGDSQ